MKQVFTLLFIFLLIFSVNSVFSQNFILNGSGARAAGMGYAFTGISDDATAISWNSAGLTQLTSMEASVVGRLGFGSLDIADDDIDVETGSQFQLNFASFVFPFSSGGTSIVGGIAFRRVYDFTQDLKITSMDYEYTSVSTGGVNAITPAVGVAFNEMISAGVAVNLFGGSTEIEEEEVVNGFTSYEDDYKEEYSGTAIDIGVLVKPNQKLSLGANFNLPHTLTIKDDDMELELSVPFFYNIGMAFRATDNLTLAFDYRGRPWSGAEAKFEDFDETVEPFDLDANSIHVGLEYLFVSANSVLPIRLGFFTQPTLQEDFNEDQITKAGFSAGLGIVMESFIIDGSVEFIAGNYVGAQDSFGDDLDYKERDIRITIGGVIHLGK